MLNKLITFSLAQRPTILVAAIIILVLGVKTVRDLPVEVLPDLTKPTVTILTESPGLSPEEVETRVTVPLENALMGVNGVTRLRSVNDIGLSLIFIEFDWGTDIYEARQFVQERLITADEILPEKVRPYMTPAASLMGNIMLVGLVDPSGEIAPEALRSIAEWDIARQLQSIPGISEVLSMGGGVEQIQILPNPERMRAEGISYQELQTAASQIVNNSTGGFLNGTSQEIIIRNISMTSDLKEIEQTVIKQKEQRQVLLKDVARVQWGTEPMRGDAGMGSRELSHATGSIQVKGYPGVIISITKSPNVDTLALTERLETVLADLQTTLPEGVRLLTLYRQSDFIELAVGNLQEALRDGAMMVALVLFLFLLNFRITLITLTAIPLSLGITVIIFDLFGLSVNSMTLGGLAVAIGMVVDDAIVDVENVFRRLRENAQLTQPLDRLTVIAKASAEVRSSILYATILIILVFLPLMALSGVEGKLFTPIAIATIISMAASFIVSLTVIPVLSSFLLNPKAGKKANPSWVEQQIRASFRHTLIKLGLFQPILTLAVAALLLLGAVVSFSKLGGNFLPAFREPTLLIAMTTQPGTSLQQTTQLSLTAQDRLLQIPGVTTVGYRVGRAERGDHIVPVSTSEFDVEFEESPDRSREQILANIRETMNAIPGTFSAMSGPLADRVGHMLSGVSAKIAIKVYGPDLEELRRIGTDITTIARQIDGLEEARMEQQASISQLRIEVDRERARAYGMTPGEINEQVSQLMEGTQVAEVYEQQRTYDVVVRLPDEWRESPQRLANLYLDRRTGPPVPLAAVASIREALGPNNILRENTVRRFVVSINPTSDNLNQMVETLQQRVEEAISLPVGYRISFEGEYEAQAKAKQTILISSTIILLLIIFLLYSYFKSFSLVLLVLTIVPLSLIGSVLLTGFLVHNISIATIVGLIAVSGIAARNNIMLISHYLHVMRHEGESFTREMVIRATEERVIPVLMTAISAGLALVPILMSAQEPGKEILHPIAVVIVGGLISSTVLGLALTPSLFYFCCRSAACHAVDSKSAASE